MEQSRVEIQASMKSATGSRIERGLGYIPFYFHRIVSRTLLYVVMRYVVDMMMPGGCLTLLAARDRIPLS